MYKAPRYRRRHSHWLLLTVIVILLIIGIKKMTPLVKNWSFDPQQAVINSELKSRNIDLKIDEAVAPLSGIRAWVLTDKTNPIISMSILFKNAGSSADDENKQGLAKMLAALAIDGAGDYSAQELHEELEMRAIKLNFAAGIDDMAVSLLTTKDNLQQSGEILQLILEKPRLAEEDIKRVKLQLAEALKRQKENNSSVLQQEFLKELYGKHPYGRNSIGREQDIENITAKDLRQAWYNHFGKSNILVGIAGDIEVDEAKILLDKIFARLPDKTRLNFVRTPEVKFDGRSKKINRVKGQNMLIKVLPAVERNNKDFYPLFVANHIWGGSGLTSRLSQQIREKNALTYGVYSYLSLRDKSPLLAVSFSSEAKNFAKANEILLAETEKFKRKGVTQEELKQAKDYLIASYNLRFASIENISEMLVMMQNYDLGVDFFKKRNDYIAKISLKEVNNAANKYFDKDNMVSVEVGKF